MRTTSREMPRVGRNIPSTIAMPIKIFGVFLIGRIIAGAPNDP
jgi:hypothetical protein